MRKIVFQRIPRSWLILGLVFLFLSSMAFSFTRLANSQSAPDLLTADLNQANINRIDIANSIADFSRLQSCIKPSAGGYATSPNNIIVNKGNPTINFTIRQANEQVVDRYGQSKTVTRDCYVYDGGSRSTVAPTIRVNPGDRFTLRLKNELPQAGSTMPDMAPANSSNLHFHGLNVSPRQPQDEVIKTIIQPAQIFTYQVNIPKDEPPGMYWYHPHVHMLSVDQVQGGLSGALIVQGISKTNPEVKKLQERVFVLRDQAPLNDPAKNPEPQSWQDVSINGIPIISPNSIPAKLTMTPGKEQFWRVANASANSYFDLQVRYNGQAQNLNVIARDGISLDEDDGKKKSAATVVQSILLPPASRAEFIVPALPNGASGEFLTLTYKTGVTDEFGDLNLQRTLAQISPSGIASGSASQINPQISPIDVAMLESNLTGLVDTRSRFTNLMKSPPQKQRTFYFSQCTNDPLPGFLQSYAVYFPKCINTVGNPEFYITEAGKAPQLYMNNAKPSVMVNRGAIEDWRIVNLDQEAHVFHIHQVHFRVLESPNSAKEVQTLRDTINVPGWNGQSAPPTYSTNLRMDFRGDIAGTFLYHCHILEHEDKGMMAKIQVN